MGHSPGLRDGVLARARSSAHPTHSPRKASSIGPLFCLGNKAGLAGVFLVIRDSAQSLFWRHPRGARGAPQSTSRLDYYDEKHSFEETV
jgi:hypothetical protein